MAPSLRRLRRRGQTRRSALSLRFVKSRPSAGPSPRARLASSGGGGCATPAWRRSAYPSPVSSPAAVGLLAGPAASASLTTSARALLKPRQPTDAASRRSRPPGTPSSACPRSCVWRSARTASRDLAERSSRRRDAAASLLCVGFKTCTAAACGFLQLPIVGALHRRLFS